MNTYLPKILITGGQGQLASALHHHQDAKAFNLQLCNRQELDITHTISIDSALAKYKPDLIINTAAYTAVDKAEEDKESALKINYIGVKNLVQACKKNQLPLIHLSTDYIFSGDNQSAYQEENNPSPINFYGETKLLGEQIISDSLCDFIILRVSGIFSEYGHNFLKTMLRLGQEKKTLRIVSDQITCPTYALDIAHSILVIAKQYSLTQKISWGIYHYSSANPISWHQFAVSIFAKAQQCKNILIPETEAVPTSEYKTAAKRPMHSVLACNKIFTDFAIEQPSWEKGIDQSLAAL